MLCDCEVIAYKVCLQLALAVQGSCTWMIQYVMAVIV
jgi:hypothetical protein